MAGIFNVPQQGPRLKRIEKTALREAEICPQPDSEFSREALLSWMQYMEDYGDAWLNDMGRAFFSQEYWYLFVVTLARYWRETPLTVSEACRCMKTGSFKTRENRLAKLISEGWFVKRKGCEDKRRSYLEPTEKLLSISGNHLTATLGTAVDLLESENLLGNGANWLRGSIRDFERDLAPIRLLPWAEFLIDYTNDWNRTFNNRFHTDKYWYPFVHSLRAHWAGRPLTTSEACGCMAYGSDRTRETRIGLAVNRGMLTRRKQESDLRKTLLVPDPVLEGLLVEHFSRTLMGVLRLAQGLLRPPEVA